MNAEVPGSSPPSALEKPVAANTARESPPADFKRDGPAPQVPGSPPRSALEKPVAANAARESPPADFKRDGSPVASGLKEDLETVTVDESKDKTVQRKRYRGLAREVAMLQKAQELAE